MLIRLYKVKRPGLELLNEYYRWSVEVPEPIREEKDDPTRMGPAKIINTHMPCPGCGRLMTPGVINNIHKCPGTLTDHPVSPNKTREPNATDQARLEAYLKMNKHIIVSD